jgi:hypothetical protein
MKKLITLCTACFYANKSEKLVAVVANAKCERCGKEGQCYRTEENDEPR